MLVSVIRIGNSRGIRFPKVVLERLGIKDKVDMEVTDKGILISPVEDIPRTGWAEAFCRMHENNEDILEDVPEEMNNNIRTVIIASMTTKSHVYPTRHPVRFDKKSGWIVLDQIRTVDKAQLVKRLGKISGKKIASVKEVIKQMLVD